MGTGSFSGVKWPGHEVDHPPQSRTRLKKEYSYTFTSLMGFVVSYTVKFTFTLLLLLSSWFSMTFWEFFD
jgi:hypothetical protein